MVKLKGPLLSLSASGQIGDVLTFSKREKVNQVRFQRGQKDYTNDARVAQRTRYWVAVQWWKDLSADEKAEWNILGQNA